MMVMLVSQTVSVLRLYRTLEPLNLAGTSLVRTDHDSAQLLRWVVSKLSKCPAFYTLPNVPSLYFWTDQIPPTGVITTVTLNLISSEQQRNVISDLERHDELCILTIPALLSFYDSGQLATSPPLLEYIK